MPLSQVVDGVSVKDFIDLGVSGGLLVVVAYYVLRVLPKRLDDERIQQEKRFDEVRTSFSTTLKEQRTDYLSALESQRTTFLTEVNRSREEYTTQIGDLKAAFQGIAEKHSADIHELTVAVRENTVKLASSTKG